MSNELGALKGSEDGRRPTKRWCRSVIKVKRESEMRRKKTQSEERDSVKR